MTTNTAIMMSEPSKNQSLALKVQFKDEVEIQTWGRFCHRHGLLGGHSTYENSNVWLTFKTIRSASETDEVLRALNLDPMVHKAWIVTDP